MSYLSVGCSQFLKKESVNLNPWIHFSLQTIFFLSTLFLVLFGLYLPWTVTDAMGQNIFHLNCILDHYKEIRVKDHLLQLTVAIF